MVRLAASRTTAKASLSRSLRSWPLARRSLNSIVFGRDPRPIGLLALAPEHLCRVRGPAVLAASSPRPSAGTWSGRSWLPPNYQQAPANSARRPRRGQNTQLTASTPASVSRWPSPMVGHPVVEASAADLVFAPTLACCVARRTGGGGKCPTPPAPRSSSSPPRAEGRPAGGQDLLLSRTMLSNHRLPYVGRFACGWRRLATTDPPKPRGQVTRRAIGQRPTCGPRPPRRRGCRSGASSST